MAQYKVPQDVEADDKLIGPFSFRQFVYLLIAGGLVALAVGLFQIFPLLAAIPLPFVLLLVVLALPLKKDQPMETYLAALVSYVLKPRTRVWTPGQKNSIIAVTAPKKVEEARTRDLTSEEATHRLSFLAGIVDTKGYAIKGLNTGPLNDELVAEAKATSDMFETGHFESLVDTLAKDEKDRYKDAVKGMEREIKKVGWNFKAKKGLEETEDKRVYNEMDKKRGFGEPGENRGFRNESDGRVMKDANSGAVIGRIDDEFGKSDKIDKIDKAEEIPSDFDAMVPNFESDVVVKPISDDELKKKPVEAPRLEKTATNRLESAKIALANNADFSVATIAKEANRIKERNGDEVFISLR